MSKQIMIHSHSLSCEGLEISYTENGIKRTIKAEPLGACYLLRLVKYITKYRFIKNLLYVQLEITEDTVTPFGEFETTCVGRQQVTWEYFARNFGLDDEWAAEIVPHQHIHDLFYVGA